VGVEVAAGGSDAADVMGASGAAGGTGASGAGCDCSSSAILQIQFKLCRP